MNTRAITPDIITRWTEDGVKNATVIKLFNFHDYNFDGQDSSKVHYHLCEEIPLDNGDIVHNPLYSGTVTIPDALVQNWGQDDEPIFAYVVSQLPLVELSQP